jgi:hypothetical protein
MNRKRTTITAPADALATLEAEARRLGTSLTEIASEAIVEKAAQIRGRRAPRLGTGRSSDGRAARDITADPIAHPPR